AATSAFLRVNVAANAFALGWLVHRGVRQMPGRAPFRWIAAFAGPPAAPPKVLAAALILSKQVVITSHASPAVAKALGLAAAPEVDVLRVTIGPWDTARTVREQLAPDVTPHREIDQQLFDTTTAPRVGEDPTLRFAVVEDLDAIAMASFEMMEADAGSPPGEEQRHAFRETLRWKIRAERLYCVSDEHGLLFKASAAEAAPECVQLEGVYVRPDCRGRGIGRHYMALLTARLLQRFERVSLYASRDNLPACAVYDRLGFRRVERFTTLYL
ncbi:MAG: ribosomal protein S18 acetylase RimI-like enzyme, partial [Flavobacteriales bacterium]